MRYAIIYTANVHSGKQVPVEASGFMAGSEPTIKRTALTKYDSVPFVRTKEPFKRIGSFANVTSLAEILQLPAAVTDRCPVSGAKHTRPNTLNFFIYSGTS